MRRLKHYTHTIAACHIGYVSQAIVNNFIPLLFLTFQTEYGITFGRLSLIILINFATQLAVDLLAVKLVDKIGYRPLACLAHVFIALGLIGLGILPSLLPPFLGLCVPVIVYALGGGLTEVIISPLVEACPTSKKSAAMSLLHSSYCWGSVLVIALSTGFFALFGIGKWKLLACLWAAVPLLNALYFFFVPIFTLTEKGESMKPASLMKSGVFLLFVLLMLCAGAAEQCVSQWASAFAESGLGVSKATGDLMGPCLFAVLMGISRVVHAKSDGKISPVLYLGVSGALLAAGYLITALVKLPVVALLGCGLCGVAVGAMWPGLLSLASSHIPKGGTAMFALLALAGDMGCGVGPILVGGVAEASSLGTGLLCATAFPILLTVCLLLLAPAERRSAKKRVAHEAEKQEKPSL